MDTQSPESQENLPKEEAQRIAADRRISGLLLKTNTITQHQYDAAESLRAARGGNIVDNLITLGHLEPSALVDFVLTHSDEISGDAVYLELSSQLIDLIPADMARKAHLIPIDRHGETMVLAARQPVSEDTLDALEALTGLTPKVILCAPEDIDTALDTYYPDKASGSGLSQRLETDTRLSHVVHLIRGITSLPALPETVVRVKEVMEDPESSVKDVVDILTLDPPVAAKILSVANSAAYGFSNRINDLTLAVSLLGLHEIYGIVLSVAVADLAGDLKHFNYKSFWLESMCSAAAARVVAKAAGLRTLGGVFSAGLLHDIGRVVLAELKPNYAEMLPAPLWGKGLVEEEERCIGLAHPEAGYELAQHWNLPDEIAQPIRFHHAPERATAAKTHVALVALANVLACAPGESLDESEGLFDGYEAALDILRLDEEIVEAIIDEFLTLRTDVLQEPPLR